MARGLVIPLTADIRKFIRGMRLSADAVEEIGEEFDDIERKSDDAADDMVRNYERAFDRLERAADQADLDLDVSKGIKDAGGSAKVAAGALAGEVVDEFVENWGEAVRSGDYAGAVRETLSQLGSIGGAVGGPVGALIGGAVALGLTTAFDAALRDSQRVREAMENIFDQVTAAELGGKKAAAAFRRGFVDEASIDEQIVEATGADSLVAAWEEVGRIAAQTGLSQTVVTQALLGQKDAVKEVQGALKGVNTELDGVQVTAETVNGLYGETLTVQSQQVSELKNQRGELEGLLGTAEGQLQANRDTAKVEQDRRGVLKDIKAQTKGIKDDVKGTPDIDIKTNVNRREYDNLKADISRPKSFDITARLSVNAANARAQRILDNNLLA